MDHNFDPYTMLEQIQVNQKQIDINMQHMVMATNQNTKTIQDHEQRLDLNQGTINSILSSLQNQQKLLMAVFDQLQKVQSVNNTKGSQQ